METIPTYVAAGIHSPGQLPGQPPRVLPFYELITVEDGCLPFAEDGERFDVRAGEWLLLAPGRTHESTAAFGDELWFHWACFELDGPPPIARTGTVPRPDRVRGVFRDLLFDQEAGLLTRAAGASHVVLLLAELALPLAVVPTRQRAAAQALASRAASYVAAHLGDPGLATSSIAGALYCNPDYLGRVFRAVYHETLTAHIHRARVARARALFRAGDLTVEQISRETGFADARYFTRVFRRYTGSTPGRFRLMYPREPDQPS